MPSQVVNQLVIDHLLEELHEKQAALVEAYRDSEVYRQLALTAVGRVSELTKQNECLRTCLRRSLDERYGALMETDSDAGIKAVA